MTEHTANTRLKAEKRILFISFLLTVFLPLTALYAFRYFYIDYANNLWVIQYYIRYFKLYHSFPLVINTADGISGMTNPLYYGYLYYPIMATIGMALHGARRAVIIVITVQNIMIFTIYQNVYNRLFRKFTRPVYWSCGLTTVMMWNTYLITKLYSDGARTEYTAVLCLYLALGAWILSCMSINITHQVCLWMFMAWNIMFMVGSHPITAEIGGTILFIIIICSLPYIISKSKHRTATAIIGCTLLVLIILAISPWLYVIVDNSKNTSIYTNKILWNSPEGLHGLLYRLALFPYSDRSLWGGTGIIAPYLCMQINMPLFGLYVALTAILIYKHKSISRKKYLLCLFVFAISAIMYLFSSCSWIVTFTEKIFPSIQFEYRLITYVDLFMLIGTVITLITLVPDKISNKTKKMIAVLMSFSIVLSAHDVIIQLHYAYALKGMDQPDISSVSSPQSFYWGNDYADSSISVMDEEYNGCPIVNVEFDAAENQLDLAGKPVQFETTNTNNTVIKTNISASKYNHVYVDGKEILYNKLYRNSDDEYTYGFILMGKGIHTATFCSSVGELYNTLRLVSFTSLIIMSLLYGISILIIFVHVLKQLHMTQQNFANK